MASSRDAPHRYRLWDTAYRSSGGRSGSLGREGREGKKLPLPQTTVSASPTAAAAVAYRLVITRRVRLRIRRQMVF